MALLNKGAVERKHGIAEGIGNRPAFDAMARARAMRRCRAGGCDRDVLWSLCSAAMSYLHPSHLSQESAS